MLHTVRLLGDDQSDPVIIKESVACALWDVCIAYHPALQPNE